MNCVDSSAWLCYFANTKNAAHFEEAICTIEKLLVPTIVLYEVSKVLLREKGKDSAIRALAHMQQGTVVDLDATLALSAAKESIVYRLPMADSVILASAKAYHAHIWTQDEHFKDLENVITFAREPS
jgi:toxin FitB